MWTRPGVRICLCDTFRLSLSPCQAICAENRPSLPCLFLLIQAEMVAQIHPAYFSFVAQLFRTPLAKNFATFEDVRSVRYRQGLSHVMVRDQHADPGLRQVPYDLLQVLYGQRVNAGKRLVQQYERWLERQRPRNFQPPPFSA